MNVLSVVAFSFYELFSFKVQKIILDLEGHSHSFSKSCQNSTLSFIKVQVCTNKSWRKSGKNSSFMSSHLKIIILSWIFTFQFINIVPKNVPALPNMKICHLFGINLSNLNNLRSGIFFAFDQVIEWSKVHKVSWIFQKNTCVNTNVNSIK